MTLFATSKDGTQIAYEKTGSGPALVLVEGAMCYRDFGPARDVAAALADAYTVYIYDRRGRGESGDTQPYAPAREVEDLAAVIEAAGESFVMGQSSGGALVLEAAAAGVPMRKLASYEAPYVGQSEDFLAKQKQLIASGNRKGAIDYFMTTMVGGPWFLPLMMRLMPKVFTKLQAIAHTLPYDTELLDGFTVPRERFGRITVAALVLGGGKGKPNMQKAVRDVAEAVPGATLRILDGQTHQVKTAVLAPELREFFR